MNPSKKTVIFYLYQFCCIIITVVICFAIYRWGSNNSKACFALTIGAVVFLFLCFYNIIFRNDRKGMDVNVLSGLTVIAFANKLYDYEKIKTLVPILRNVDPMIFIIIVLGGVLFILLFAKLLIYLYDNAADNVYSSSSNVLPNSSKIGEDNSNSTQMSKDGSASPDNTINARHSKTWMVLYFIFLIILIGAGVALFSILYKNGILRQNYDFFEIAVSLLKYAGSVIMILLEVVIAIIFLIEMIRLIVSRMRAFSHSLKEDAKGDTIPLYALSAVLDIIVCYFAYKFTGITIDSFYSLTNSTEYLALPLLILFVGIAFVIFLRLTHATLLLLVEMKPDNVRGFLKKVNDKARITERIVEIVRMLIDIVLNSIIMVLKFVTFIPDFFGTLYLFVLEDEGEFKLGDENKEEGSDSAKAVSNQSDEGV